MRRVVSVLSLVVCVVAAASPRAFAQQAADAAQAAGLTAPPADEPPIDRWFQLQAWTLYSRYRYIENSADLKTADQVQYKHTFRAQFNIDAKKRYTVNVGFFTGNSFFGTWDNTGVGTGDAQTLQFFKQLYFSAKPVGGLELQYGGIYVNRGVNTEITTYDDDGYIMGERVTLRRPKQLYFDEISATHGLIGPFATPSLGDRWRGLNHPNYTQFLVAKRLTKRIRASADYSNQAGQVGNDWFRGAVAVTLPENPAIEGFRWEQYVRATGNSAAGFAALVDRHFTKRFALEAGYVTIDEFYIGFPADHNGWNADRIQRGKRLVFYGTIPVWGDLSIAPYFTHAFQSPYAVTLKNRLDLVIQYDLMRSLRRAGAI